jgi:quercetin dioxygenase-like cupin family protein
MPGWAAKRLHDVPRVTDGGPCDPDWYPLQHHFGLSAFGANVFVAREPGQELIGEHDERQSGQQELYIVLLGAAEFTLNGERVAAEEGTVVAVTDPSVKRRAVAVSAGTAMLALGASPTEPFVSTWQPSHFQDVPQAKS